MRKVKFLNVTFALALVAGLFAASVASVGAISPVYGPEIAGTPTIFFPFVYNGTMMDGMGPFDGSITIQNQNALPISVDVMNARAVRPWLQASTSTRVAQRPGALRSWVLLTAARV